METTEKTILVPEITTQERFEEVLKQNSIIVLDFFSPVCGPCKVVSPLYEKLARCYKKVNFYKINGYSEPGASIQKSVDVVWWPTFVVYVNGEEKFRQRVPNPPQLYPTLKLENFIKSL